MSYSD